MKGEGMDVANGRTENVGNGDDMSKADLQDCIDTATQILEDAYVPEATRADLAAAVGAALAALSGDYYYDDEDGDDDYDDTVADS
jgi:hypothetical protein